MEMSIMTDNVQVDSYRHLDLSPGGDIVKGLLAGVPAEADGSLIRLTDHVGELPW